ncbi:MAG: hypothetical protein Q9214_005959, partial [Letrouitia sp. 1 TL-2023]
GNHVMRRRHDDWINATHILKVADYDKPARTRILEREVQKGIHEKVQGGYGKYQGTWVPLHEGRLLAERNGVLAKLLPLFDFMPGPISPPQAPKHHTAASTKGPRIPKPPTVKKNRPPMSQISEDQYDNISAQLNDDDSIENSSVVSASYVDEDDMLYRQQSGSRKRKRGPEVNFYEQQHTWYADSLLDYFVLSSDSGEPYHLDPPQPPEGFQINRAVDNQDHTGLHWGAAMGDLEIVKMFINLGANVHVQNCRGETPLIRAVLFTNNYEKETLPKLSSILQGSLNDTDRFHATVFHHLAMTTKSSSRKKCARYYLQVLLNRLSDISTPYERSKLLNSQDNHGDTALHIVARHGARKCVRLLIAAGAGGDINNRNDETANQILQRQVSQRHEKFTLASSSPLGPSTQGLSNVNTNPTVAQTPNDKSLVTFPNSRYNTQSAQSFSSSFGPMVLDKGLQISLALENEIQEKDLSLADATRLEELASGERNPVRQATFRLLTENNADTGDEEAKALEGKGRALESENESFLEQEQHRALHLEVRSREQALLMQQGAADSDKRLGLGSGVSGGDLEKSDVARELAQEQMRRRELCRRVVERQAHAGMGERGEA